MSVKSIFAKFDQFFAKLASFHGPLGLVLIFALAGLTFLNHQLSFDIPAARRVRDAFDAASPFSEVTKLEPHSGAKPLATTYTSPVPTAGYYAPASRTGLTSAPATGFHISEPTPVPDPSEDARYGIMRYTGYGGRFLYAHSSLAFSPLKSLYVGSTFTATIDGVTATYRVSQRYVFHKATELDGPSNNSRRTRIYSARDESNTRHSLALMTCGNGSNDDGNYRLVLFADHI